jgi:hypothetical protein
VLAPAGQLALNFPGPGELAGGMSSPTTTPVIVVPV